MRQWMLIAISLGLGGCTTVINESPQATQARHCAKGECLAVTSPPTAASMPTPAVIYTPVYVGVPVIPPNAPVVPASYYGY